MSQSCINIAIVEDHTVFRQALAATIESTQDMVVSWVAEDVDEGLRLLTESRPDILLVDLGLPSGSGMTLIHEARRCWGDTCISVVLTMTGNETHLFKAIRAGAKGYLFKSDDESNWLSALSTLANGGGLMHSRLARHVLSEREIKLDDLSRQLLDLLAAGYCLNEAAERLSLTSHEAATQVCRCYARIQESMPGLSARETELLVLLNQGYSFRQGAQRMSIQECTAKTLAARAYQKLGATNLQEALYAARREHLFR
ncbi:response regulator [Nitrincola sp. MINF-07-Sa-05]|uniref:response regulator n=1 Tax=Nitrincola salilacus TaxID=3400273 RepID=UPI00391814AD